MNLPLELTITVSTSPIPIHPSPLLLSCVLSSLSNVHPDIHKTHLVVVFDGYTTQPSLQRVKSKQCKIDPVSAQAYETYKSLVRRCLLKHWGRDPIKPLERDPRIWAARPSEGAKQEDDERLGSKELEELHGGVSYWFDEESSGSDTPTKSIMEDGYQVEEDELEVTLHPVTNVTKIRRTRMWRVSPAILDNVSPSTSSECNNSNAHNKRPLLTILEVLGDRLGQALGVREALKEVQTPTVLVLQHDWRFAMPIPTERIIKLLQLPKPVNYIGFVSRWTRNYAQTNVSGRGFPNASLDLSSDDAEGFGDLEMCRLFFWFDKNHFANVEFYKSRVFSQNRFRRGDFIEDVYGQAMLNQIKTEGLDAWRQYRSFLYYPNEGNDVVLVHVNGRQYVSHEQRLKWKEMGFKASEAAALENNGSTEDSSDDDGGVRILGMFD
ncbi:hypothetical protein HDV05_006050 [Chytridiales sp. JEL 0842]|nr:hypothetical protein HDV05_006050 [Chytridiales sp. JEL 0842]